MFNKLKLSAKITALAVILLVITAILGIVSSINMMSAGRTSTFIAEEITPSISISVPMLKAVDGIYTSLASYSYTSEPSYAEEVRSSMRDLNQLFNRADSLLRFAQNLPVLAETVRNKRNLLTLVTSSTDTLFALGVRQVTTQSELAPIGLRLSQDLMSLRNDVVRENERGMTTSSATDRDAVVEIMTGLLQARIDFNIFIQTTDTSGAGQVIAGMRQGLSAYDRLINSNTFSTDLTRRVTTLRPMYENYVNLIQ